MRAYVPVTAAKPQAVLKAGSAKREELLEYLGTPAGETLVERVAKLLVHAERQEVRVKADGPEFSAICMHTYIHTCILHNTCFTSILEEKLLAKELVAEEHNATQCGRTLGISSRVRV